MSFKSELYDKIYYKVLDKLYKLDIDIFFRRNIRGLNRKSKLVYKLTPEMKRDYISYYKSFGFRKVHTDWLEYIYGITGKYDRRYVPDDIFTKYIDWPYKINRIPWLNKAYQPKILDGVTFPETIIRRVNGFFLDSDYNLISEDAAIATLNEYDEVIFKPATGSSGLGINYYRGKDITANTFSGYDGDVIVQKLIVQSDLMKLFVDDCVNIIKITSFMFHDEVHIVSARVIGGKSQNRTSNKNAYMVAVDSDGVLAECGFTHEGERVYTTEDGINFSDIRLDFYQECIDIIKYGHKKLLNFPFISWDFTQDSNGHTVLIEYNLKWHVLNFIQVLSGPAFGDFTDDVLKEASDNVHKIIKAEF